MASPWKDKWFIAVLLLLGVALLALWVVAGESVFQGNARSLMAVNTLVLGLALIGVIGVVSWRNLPRKTILPGVLVVAAGFFIAMAAGAVFVASGEGHCGGNPRMHATWDEPGVVEAAWDGFPGATLLSDQSWARTFGLDAARTQLTIHSDDRVSISSADTDWETVQMQVNQTLGQVMGLTYGGVERSVDTEVC